MDKPDMAISVRLVFVTFPQSSSCVLKKFIFVCLVVWTCYDLRASAMYMKIFEFVRPHILWQFLAPFRFSPLHFTLECGSTQSNSGNLFKYTLLTFSKHSCLKLTYGAIARPAHQLRLRIWNCL
jgi:hypothetical protein